MKISLLILVCLSLLSENSIAEVFKCVQPDGSTVYAYVPCVTKPAENKPLNGESTIGEDQETALHVSQPIKQQQMTEIENKIAILQQKISDLQNEQDEELYAAETTVVEQAALYDLQRSIRNRFKIALDKSLLALATLRREKDFLLLSPEASITNAH